MDNTLLAGIFGLFGSLIGGVVSYYGSKQAAENNINAQNEENKKRIENEKKQHEEKIKLYARIAYSEITIAIYECIRNIKNIRDESGNCHPIFSIHPQHADIVSTLSEHLSGDDIVNLNRAYTILNKIQFSLFDRNEAGIGIDSKLYVYEIYHTEKAEYLIAYDPKFITLDFLKTEIPNPYRSLLRNLNSIGEINDSVIN